MPLGLTSMKFKRYVHYVKNFLLRIGGNIRVAIEIFFTNIFRKNSIDQAYKKSLIWIKNNTLPNQGIITNSFYNKTCHIEVTGYLIPTLMEAGEIDLAKQYASFLAQVQQPNGSFTARDGKEYVFDSSQALRGLLSASKKWPNFKPFAVKTSDYMLSLIQENGRVPSMYEGITENIHVFMLPVLVEAAQVLGEQKYFDAAKKSLTYYKNQPFILNKDLLTHDLAYIIDGFIDMGEIEFILPIVKEVFSRQLYSGKISARPKVNWVCSTGVAQFAIIGYKLNMKENADKALEYLSKKQNALGGFYGSYGILGDYFNDVEIGWTNKFFMDAVHLKRSLEKNK